jgi:hypothetical protein
MRNVPIHHTGNWMICNSIHAYAQCSPDYTVSELSMHDRMLVTNDKGRKRSAECSNSNRDVPCVFVYIRRAGLFT